MVRRTGKSGRHATVSKTDRGVSPRSSPTAAAFIALSSNGTGLLFSFMTAPYVGVAPLNLAQDVAPVAHRGIGLEHPCAALNSDPWRNFERQILLRPEHSGQCSDGQGSGPGRTARPTQPQTPRRDGHQGQQERASGHVTDAWTLSPAHPILPPSDSSPSPLLTRNLQSETSSDWIRLDRRQRDDADLCASATRYRLAASLA